MPRLNDRTGEKKVNKCGSVIEIIEYTNNKDLLIKFLDTGETVRTSYSTFNRGAVTNSKNKYSKTIYSIGCFGEGIHKYMENGKMTHKYKTWHGMMRRCYDEKFENKTTIYKDVTVAEVWHNFQNFGDWYEENYYVIDGHRMCLDKDILIKGNRIYSPDTCIFVPSYINTLFVNQDSIKGEIPTCTFYDPNKKSEKKYTVRTHSVHIGVYKTPEEAFHAYKRHKELLLRDAANEYKDKIPERLYKAMLNYKIELIG